MTSLLESTHLVREWSTPAKKTVEGAPPGPETRPNTVQEEMRRQDVKTVSPFYKTGGTGALNGDVRPSPSTTLSMSSKLSTPTKLTGSADYKVHQTQDHYKLHIIDPKVQSTANMPVSSQTLPSAFRKKPASGDFPSQHTKRSFLKLAPIEQRRLRSVETRPITTSTYLTESLERHRDMEASRLRDYLKAKEKDANQPWNKPNWPGPREDDTSNSLQELENIRKQIEGLQKSIQRTQSMGELMLEPPEDFATRAPQPEMNVDPGWLVRVRKNRYLDSVEEAATLKRAASVDHLRQRRPSSGRDHYSPERPSSAASLVSPNSLAAQREDFYSWKLKKELELAKYMETKPSPSEPPPLPQSAPPPLDKGDRSKKVALYPTSTADKPVSEKTPVVRPRERTIFESKPRPTPPDVLSEKSPAPPQEDRVVFESQPLSPTHQPKSILKSAPSTSSSAVPHSGGGAYGRSETVSETIISSTSEQRMAAWRSGYEIVETSTHRPASTLPYQPSLNDQATMERERHAVMQENLRRLRERSATPTIKYPPASFHGPFFKLEEVGQMPSRSQSVAPLLPVSEQMSATEEYYRQQEFDYEQRQRDQYRHQQHSGPPPVAPKPPKQPLSGSELELNKHNGGLDDRRVVVWPPNSDHRRRPASAMARSITDPDRIEEYQRQKQQEAEAIRHREEVLIHQQHKQIQALQKQQHRLYTQAIQEEGGQGPPPQIMPRPPSSQPLHHFGQSQPSAHTNHMMSPPPSSLSQPINDQQQGHQPLSLRVFETRPISSLSVSDLTDPRDYMLSPGGSTWKRSYVVDQATSADRLKNEIVTSDELLDKEAYYVDLLARRDAFVEKVELPPQVHRTGKRWQPPPDKPYVWPTLRRPVTVDTPTDDTGAYRWDPVIIDPDYKFERKNFTPEHSPPVSPRRGLGTGTLDDAARRQTRYVVQPSPDGSHRPKAAFKTTRQRPAGGFLPQAPNSVKTVKMRVYSPQDASEGSSTETVQHQRQFQEHHRRYEQHRRREEQHQVRQQHQQHQQQAVSHQQQRRLPPASQQQRLEPAGQEVPEWEKIYDLPPHSSTITGKDTPVNVDIKKRLAIFEGDATIQRRTAVQRMHSVDAQQHAQQTTSGYGSGQGPGLPRSQKRLSRHSTLDEHQQHYRQPQAGPSQAAVGAVSPYQQPRRPPSQPQLLQQQYPQRQLQRYYPPPLPPGYRAANERPDRNEELERLAALREQLLERSKRRPNDFKGTESEIQKEGPAPVPDFIKDQIRERLESRVSNDTSSTSIIMPQDRSGYITSFSPRSVVSINGGTKDDSGLLKVRTDLSPGSSRLSRTLSRSNAAVQTAHMESVQMPQAPWPYMPAVLVPIGNSPASTMTREFNESYSRKMERYNSLPVLDSDDKHSTLIKIQDENRNKPRSIMKRRELETKEQMLFSNGDHRTLERPGAARHWQEHEVIRTQPSVTETVQKFEESKRTEEVERRVSSKQKEKKHRREHRSSRHRHHDQAMIGDYPAWTSPMELQATRTLSTASEPSRSVAPPKPPVRIYQQRAYTAEDLNLALKQAYQAVEEADRIVRNSSSRQYHTTSRSQQRSNGYQPAAENYYRSSTTKRLRDQSADDYRNGGGLSHARYGSLSDSLRRGELKYIPNGDIRERHSSHSNGRVHKSISNRDVFHGDMHDDRSYSSFRAGPIVEFPPTLPRGGAPMPPPHRNGFGGNQLSKSRSYADWDDGKGWGSALRRYDDDMTRLESEFQDSLLMPLPNGQNMHEKDYREEKLPGGYESLQREVKSNAGRRLNRDGNPTQFNESKQEYNYKRETESDRRR